MPGTCQTLGIGPARTRTVSITSTHTHLHNSTGYVNLGLDDRHRGHRFRQMQTCRLQNYDGNRWKSSCPLDNSVYRSQSSIGQVGLPIKHRGRPLDNCVPYLQNRVVQWTTPCQRDLYDKPPMVNLLASCPAGSPTIAATFLPHHREWLQSQVWSTPRRLHVCICPHWSCDTKTQNPSTHTMRPCIDSGHTINQLVATPMRPPSTHGVYGLAISWTMYIMCNITPACNTLDLHYTSAHPLIACSSSA